MDLKTDDKSMEDFDRLNIDEKYTHIFNSESSCSGRMIQRMNRADRLSIIKDHCLAAFHDIIMNTFEPAVQECERITQESIEVLEGLEKLVTLTSESEKHDVLKTSTTDGDSGGPMTHLSHIKILEILVTQPLKVTDNLGGSKHLPRRQQKNKSEDSKSSVIKFPKTFTQELKEDLATQSHEFLTPKLPDKLKNRYPLLNEVIKSEVPVQIPSDNHAYIMSRIANHATIASDSILDSVSIITDAEIGAISLSTEQSVWSVKKTRKRKARSKWFTHIKRHSLKFGKNPELLVASQNFETLTDEKKTGKQNLRLLTTTADEEEDGMDEGDGTVVEETKTEVRNRKAHFHIQGNDHYEPHQSSWDAQEEVVDSKSEDDDLEDMFEELALLQEDGWGIPVSQQNISEGCCEHQREWKEEVGWFCGLCGLVIQDIQSVFIPEIPTPSKKETERSLPDDQYEQGNSLENDDLHHSFVPVKVSEILKLRLNPYYDDILHRHQKDGFKFLIRNLIGDGTSKLEPGGCILAHAPGTGKTLLTISFVQSFLTALPGGRVLIVAPKIMLKVWQKEFDRWNAEELPAYNLNECCAAETKPENKRNNAASSYETLKIRRMKVIKRWLDSRSVLLVSYNLFATLIQSGLKDEESGSLRAQICQGLLAGPELMILDEGHFPRNKKTKISQALMRVHTKRKILLSGTLFQNNFRELFNLLKLARDNFLCLIPEFPAKLKRLEERKLRARCKLGLPLLPSSAEDINLSHRECEEQIFMEEIGYKLEEFVQGDQKVLDMNHVLEKLRTLTCTLVHWYTGKILDSLPGLMEYVVYLNITDQQQKLHCHLNCRRGLEEKIRLSELCIHPVLLKGKDEDKLRTFSGFEDPNEGVKTAFIFHLLRLSQISGERLLVFCQTLAPLALLGSMFAKKLDWSKGKEFLFLDGTMQSDERQHVIQQFNADGNNIKVLMASITACKEGISLVGASRVVILDVLYNPSVVRQAVSRAFRIGQKKKVFVYRLVAADTREEGIFQGAIQKDWLSRVLMDQSFRLAAPGNHDENILQVDHAPNDRLLERIMIDDKSKRINRICRYQAQLN